MADGEQLPATEDRSIRDDVIAALEAHSVEPAGDPPPAETAKPAEQQTPSAEAKTPADAGQPRGADGRFAEKPKGETKPAETAAKPSEAAAATPSPDQSTAKPETPAPKAGEPPATWSAAAKAEWQKASPVLQAETLKRERDFAEGIRQQAERYKPAVEFSNNVLATLKPHESDYRAQGLNEAQAVAWLTQMHSWFKRDAKGYARHVAQAAGLQIAGEQPASAPTNGAAPTSDPVIGQLTQRLNTIDASIEADKRARAEAARNADVSAVDVFAKATGADGKPLRPHFNAVREDMVRIANTLPNDLPFEQALAQAYETAVWANPTVRAQLLQEKETEAAAKRDADSKVAAERARKAATPVVGSPGGASNGADPDDLRELLRQNIRRASAA